MGEVESLAVVSLTEAIITDAGETAGLILAAISIFAAGETVPVATSEVLQSVAVVSFTEAIQADASKTAGLILTAISI